MSGYYQWAPKRNNNVCAKYQRSFKTLTYYAFYFFFLVPKVIANKYFNTDILFMDENRGWSAYKCPWEMPRSEVIRNMARTTQLTSKENKKLLKKV